MSVTTELPDFGLWKTTRLEFLYVEYAESLGAVRHFYGDEHPETKLYERWVAAIEAELASRKAEKR